MNTLFLCGNIDLKSVPFNQVSLSPVRRCISLYQFLFQLKNSPSNVARCHRVDGVQKHCLPPKEIKRLAVNVYHYVKSYINAIDKIVEIFPGGFYSTRFLFFFILHVAMFAFLALLWI